MKKIFPTRKEIGDMDKMEEEILKIIRDKELMEQIKESERNIEENKIKEFVY